MNITGHEALLKVIEILGIPKERRVFHISLDIPINGVPAWIIKCHAREGEIEAATMATKGAGKEWAAYGPSILQGMYPTYSEWLNNRAKTAEQNSKENILKGHDFTSIEALKNKWCPKCHYHLNDYQDFPEALPECPGKPQMWLISEDAKNVMRKAKGEKPISVTQDGKKIGEATNIRQERNDVICVDCTFSSGLSTAQDLENINKQIRDLIVGKSIAEEFIASCPKCHGTGKRRSDFQDKDVDCECQGGQK